MYIRVGKIKFIKQTITHKPQVEVARMNTDMVRFRFVIGVISTVTWACVQEKKSKDMAKVESETRTRFVSGIASLSGSHATHYAAGNKRGRRPEIDSPDDCHRHSTQQPGTTDALHCPREAWSQNHFKCVKPRAWFEARLGAVGERFNYPQLVESCLTAIISVFPQLSNKEHRGPQRTARFGSSREKSDRGTNSYAVCSGAYFGLGRDAPEWALWLAEESIWSEGLMDTRVENNDGELSLHVLVRFVPVEESPRLYNTMGEDKLKNVFGVGIPCCTRLIAPARLPRVDGGVSTLLLLLSVVLGTPWDAPYASGDTMDGSARYTEVLYTILESEEDELNDSRSEPTHGFHRTCSPDTFQIEPQSRIVGVRNRNLTVRVTRRMADKQKRGPSRRVSLVGFTPGEASEDGDYVQLRAVRVKNLEKIDEDDEFEGDKVPREFVASPNQKERIRPSSAPANKQLESLRQKLFAAAVSGSTSDLQQVIADVKSRVPLSDVSMLDCDSRQNVLHYALEKGNISSAKNLLDADDGKLLQQDYDVLKSGIHAKKNAFHLVAEKKNVEFTKDLLNRISNADIKKRLLLQETAVEIEGQRPRTFNPFHLAAFLGSSELVELYLKCGIAVNQPNAKKDTALLWAARWGHEQTVKTLLVNKADPDLANDKGSTALYWAVRYEHVTTAEILLQYGKANPNKTRKLGLVAPIIVAAAYGNDKLVHILLDYGADVNFCIRGNERPLHHAAREGYPKVIKTLLDRGASIHDEDERGDTAIILAARSDHVKVIKLLLSRGANPTHKNHNGNDAWHFAIESDSKDILYALVEYDRQMADRPESQTRSPLCIASAMGRTDKVGNLLKMGIDPTVTDSDGNNLVHCAALNNQCDVINKYYSKVDIDAQNKKGSTALHIACSRGYEETILALIHNKAKANITNKRGETALHVAAYSRQITPEAVKALVEYTIKAHAWESLNATDQFGNNALHIAGRHADPGVLWEFRFVRFKDKNGDGNLPLHEAVRPDDPDGLEGMLDIYESMKRDADINEPNNKKETVIHLAAKEGFENCVKRLIMLGADLSSKDEAGNTPLHTLVAATVEDPRNLKRHLHLFDTVVSEVVRWWCITKKLQFPDANHDSYMFFRRQALLELLSYTYNEQGMSVLTLASKMGAAEAMNKILMMKNVMTFEIGEYIRFDITNITPTTNSSLAGCCGSGKVVPTSSCLEWLVALRIPSRSAKVLDIPPMKRVEKFYSSICAWAYLVLILGHITYMSVFTYLSLAILGKLRTEPDSINEGDTTTLLMYCIVPLEPGFIILYSIYIFFKFAISGDFGLRSRLTRSKGVRAAFHMLSNYLSLIVSLLFAAMVIAWIALITVRYIYQDYILSVALCMGWLYTITFTRGFRIINYFWRMLVKMIMRDVFRFVIVYSFVLLGFGFALHVLFQVSVDLSNQFESPFDTLFLTFNLMIGMGELFDDNFSLWMEANQRTTVFPKILYLVYIVLATIVFLNLLIAMMNDSYSSILRQHKVSWRMDSVNLGIEIEKMFPLSAKLFSKIKIHCGNITEDERNAKEIRWYIQMPKNELRDYLLEQDRDDTDVFRITKAIERRLDDVDKKMHNQDKHLQDKLTEIQLLLESMQSKH
ncbi:hypothetical protein ScPMuIL_013170 [Solemya velum]